ncbi:NACHT domain-containing protein [Acaryochloris marina]|uniref:NACHT domain-containing protein n=1 Tax=Acaryochloris marina (strain MBIC 11017) TaxID=329726 RepID=A8ZP98_ACAM1|nr:NACHT domain-containing protein [Acaryochloris marina]ABW32834.1 conserved hypothetical protein [Acaryochloris marina MBIC11017]
MNKQPNQGAEKSLNISDSVLKDVQIGGISGGDLELTQIQKVGVVNVYGTVQVPQTPLSTTKPLRQDEYRWRQVLLSKVQQFWIDGVLSNSLHTRVLIELGLEERSEYVHSPLAGVKEISSETINVLPNGTSAADVFENIGAGRTLLILGEPGAGKTVTLLKLAESLLARTSKDLSQPLPVVVNLSSWARQRKSIEDWLVQELYETYTVSKSLGKAWIEEEQLILLLDGLDEVDAQHRNTCVKALNQFIQTHGRTEMVVCSRIRDYEALTEELSLRSAIYVQPLTLQQIDDYLERSGDSLANLRSMLSQNSEIKAFASSPLILSIMSLSYQDSGWKDFSQPIASDAFHQQLFDTYIQRMFKRRGTTLKYLQPQSRRWLIWLSQRMVQHSQVVFLIERLQPNWLQTKPQRTRYQLASGLMVMLVFMLVFGLIGGLMLGSYLGLIFGSYLALFIGLLPSIVIGFLRDIRTVESLRTSRKVAVNASLLGLIIGLIIGLTSGLYFGLSFGLIYWLLYWLLYWLISGFRGPEVSFQKKFKANQGLWMTARNTLIFGLFFGLIGGIAFGLIGGFEFWLPIGLIGFSIFGMIGGLYGGGAACLQHFTLRFMLYRMGYIPWNYSRFLDYAVERLFLQKVGGGYIFIHRMLLEHFARMNLQSLQNNN